MILPFVGSPCALADDVAGAGLGLHIDLADVFADDAQTHQLDAAHEADDADGGGPARHGAAQNSLHIFYIQIILEDAAISVMQVMRFLLLTEENRLVNSWSLTV